MFFYIKLGARAHYVEALTEKRQVQPKPEAKEPKKPAFSFGKKKAEAAAEPAVEEENPKKQAFGGFFKKAIKEDEVGRGRRWCKLTLA